MPTLGWFGGQYRHIFHTWSAWVRTKKNTHAWRKQQHRSCTDGRRHWTEVLEIHVQHITREREGGSGSIRNVTLQLPPRKMAHDASWPQTTNRNGGPFSEVRTALTGTAKWQAIDLWANWAPIFQGNSPTCSVPACRG